MRADQITNAITLGALLAVAVPAVATPELRVPGRALIKLDGIHAQRLQFSKPDDMTAKNALKSLSARTQVDVTLVRPVVLGWALVDVRVAGSRLVPSEAETMALIERVAADPAVASATDEKWLRPYALPNDPGIPNMWHLADIGASAAWDITTGLSSQRVGVVDTGVVRTHEDLASRVVAGYDFISSGSGDGNGRDTDYNDPGDSCGSGYHGSHTAGTIGAAANNGEGIAGLNWNAGLVIARTLDSCGGSLTDIMEGAAWLAGATISGVANVGANKVSVMNLSLGSGGGCSGFEQEVVDFVNGEGIMFVAATGNDGGGVGSPANCSGVISVAASGPDGNLTGYSNFGTSVEIVAPGGNQDFGNDSGVLSSVGPGNSDYAYFQGTSMAAPHAAGVISLMQARDPTLTRQEIVTILQDTGTVCGGCNGVPNIHAGAAVAAVTGGTPPPPPPPDPTDDALEENDTYEEAKAGVGCNVIRDDLYAAADDFDWFLVETTPGTTLNLSMIAAGGADLDLVLLDGPTDNDVLGSSLTETGTEALTYTTDVGGTLRVLVYGFVDQTNNIHHADDYTLSVGCTGGVTDPTDPPVEDPTDPPVEDPTDPPVAVSEDDLEDNDSAPQAKELFCSEERTLAALDDDWFKVEVREGDALRAQITADVALDVQIAAPEGTDPIAEGDAADAVGTASLAAGEYFIKVSPRAGTGAYRLTVVCAPAEQIPLKLKPKASCNNAGDTLPVFSIALLGLLLRRRRA